MLKFIEGNIFWIGIITGIIASACWALFTKLVKFAISALKDFSLFNVYTKSLVRFVYDKQDNAKDDMYEDAKFSQKIYVFSSFGATFTDRSTKMFELMDKNDCDIKFLILDPDSPCATKRAKELNMDSSFISKIRVSINELRIYDNIRVKLYNTQSRIRLYIFDDFLYLGFRLKGKSDTDNGIYATDTQLWRISKNSILYECFSQYFFDIWEESSAISANNT